MADRAPGDAPLGDFTETRVIHFEWKLTGLKQLFDGSRGDVKSKCQKSALYDGGKWQLYWYANSGSEQYCSVYLSCEPTAAEKEAGMLARPAMLGASDLSTLKKGSGTPWKREGQYKFTFEARSLDKRVCYKTMQANDHWHSFSSAERNWGWAQFWSRSDAFYNNAAVRAADGFVISCELKCAATAPLPPTVPRHLVPYDLVEAYSTLFDDPDYADVVFRIKPSGPTKNGKRPREKRIYAAKRLLSCRSDYFETMFSSESGFLESGLPDYSPPASPVRPVKDSPAAAADLSASFSAHGGAASSYGGRGDAMEEDEDDEDEFDDDSDYESTLASASEVEEEDEEEDAFEEYSGAEDAAAVFESTTTASSYAIPEEAATKPPSSAAVSDDEADHEPVVSAPPQSLSVTSAATADSRPVSPQASFSTPAVTTGSTTEQSTAAAGGGGMDMTASTESEQSVRKDKPSSIPTASSVAGPSSKRKASTGSISGPGGQEAFHDAQQSVPPSPMAASKRNRENTASSVSSAVAAMSFENHDTSLETITGSGARGAGVAAAGRGRKKSSAGKDGPARKVIPAKRTKKATKKDELPDKRARTEVVITDASYRTFRSLLYYIYTDHVSFQPLASSYTVAKENALEAGAPFPFPSRKNFIEAMVPSYGLSGIGPSPVNNLGLSTSYGSATGNLGSSSSMIYPTHVQHRGLFAAPSAAGGGKKAPPMASAKAVYVAADKMGLVELKDRAFEHICKSLTIENIPYEVFGSFAQRYDDVKKVEMAFLLSHWNEARASKSMKRVFGKVRWGRYPGFEEVFAKILESLDYRPNRENGGLSTED